MKYIKVYEDYLNNLEQLRKENIINNKNTRINNVLGDNISAIVDVNKFIIKPIDIANIKRNTILLIDFEHSYENPYTNKFMKICDALDVLNILYHKTRHDSANINHHLDKLGTKYCGIILSGSTRMQLDNASNISNKFIEYGLPIFGICYGFQYLATYFGSKIIMCNNGTGEHGKIKTTLYDSRIFKNYDIGTSTHVNTTMSHYQSIDSVPDNSKLIARTELTPYAGFEMEDRKIYGVQFHPEKDEHYIIFRNFYDICIKEVSKTKQRK